MKTNIQFFAQNKYPLGIKDEYQLHVLDTFDAQNCLQLPMVHKQ